MSASSVVPNLRRPEPRMVRGACVTRGGLTAEVRDIARDRDRGDSLGWLHPGLSPDVRVALDGRVQGAETTKATHGVPEVAFMIRCLEWAAQRGQFTRYAPRVAPGVSARAQCTCGIWAEYPRPQAT